MTLTVEYRHSTRDGGPWLSRTLQGPICEFAHKLILAGRNGLRSDELLPEALGALRFASIPTEFFNGSGPGWNRRIRIKAGWAYRVVEVVAFAA